MRRIIVLAKQVPDTSNITGNAMKEDGTVNRAALPAIFNPEDLNALELALTLKDMNGAEVVVLSMGPLKAVEVLKHSLYLGADKVYLISDRKFSGADTLATSYVLSGAIRFLGGADLIVAGRQAIDGDTGQVGAQVAEKLGYNIISYVKNLISADDDGITVEKEDDLRTETIRTRFPLLLTITNDANFPRYPNAVNILKYFKADLDINIDKKEREKYKMKNLLIPTLNLEQLGLNPERCGLKGSPTKVHNIKNIVLKGGDLKIFENNPGGIMGLVSEIIKDYTEAGS